MLFCNLIKGVLHPHKRLNILMDILCQRSQILIKSQAVKVANVDGTFKCFKFDSRDDVMTNVSLST